MRGAWRFVAGFVVAFTLAATKTAAGYHTQFVANNCNWAAPTPIDHFTRDVSITVALYARHEGYQWGGGGWNARGVLESPDELVISRGRKP